MIAGTAGQVVLHHRQGDLPCFPLFKQVFAAHESLKLRKLTDHLTHEIVLAEVGSSDGGITIGRLQAQLVHQLTGDALDPAAAIQQAAESLSEGDPVESVSTAAAGLTTVHGQEELRIRQASSKNPLIAAGDQGIRLLKAIAHEQEVPSQDPRRDKLQRIRGDVGNLQRHIALVGLHHGDDHLRRQRQKALGNGSAQQPRRFNEIHQLLKQRCRTVRRTIQLLS